MTDEEMGEMRALRESMDALRAEVEKANAARDWLFLTPPGDEESRAETIMRTCRRVAKLDTQIRTGVRVVTAAVGLISAWKAGLGEWVIKLFSEK